MVPAENEDERRRRRRSAWWLRLPRMSGRYQWLLSVWRAGGHPHREGGALAVDAGGGQVAAHQAAKVAADRQSQPGATVLACRTGLGLTERLEEPPQHLLGHADTRVRDGEGQPVA